MGGRAAAKNAAGERGSLGGPSRGPLAVAEPMGMGLGGRAGGRCLQWGSWRSQAGQPLVSISISVESRAGLRRTADGLPHASPTPPLLFEEEYSWLGIRSGRWCRAGAKSPKPPCPAL